MLPSLADTGQDMSKIHLDYKFDDATGASTLSWSCYPMRMYWVEKSTDLSNWTSAGLAIGPAVTPHMIDSKRQWKAVATSFDGSVIVAVVSAGHLYVSLDYGNTWIDRMSAGSRYWSTVACDSTGAKMVATVTDGYIYTSSDFGSTWQQVASSRNWYSISSSADGTKLAAVVKYGYVYTSVDSGVTWIERSSSGSRNWTSVAIDSSGMKLVAAVNGGSIWTSQDGGSTWTRIPNPLDGVVNGTDYTNSYAWYSVASSLDGSKVFASNALGGPVRTSVDSGVTWSDNGWTESGISSMSVDALGVNLIAIGDWNNRLMISQDSCLTGYYSSEKTYGWVNTCISRDGKRIVAVESNGYIYTSIVGNMSFNVYDQGKGSAQYFYRIKEY